MDARLQRLPLFMRPPHDCVSGVAETALWRDLATILRASTSLGSLVGAHLCMRWCAPVCDLLSWHASEPPDCGAATGARKGSGGIGRRDCCCGSMQPTTRSTSFVFSARAWSTVLFGCRKYFHEVVEVPRWELTSTLSHVYAQRRYTLGYVTRSGFGYTLP